VLVATDVARRKAADLELSEEAVRAVFEAARSADQLDGAAALARRQGDTATEVLAARAAVDAERSLETEVGLLGEAEPAGLVSEAVDALAGGDADAASNLAGRARDALVAAAARGRERLTAAAVAGVAGAVLLAILLVGVAVVLVRRRRRRARAGVP